MCFNINRSAESLNRCRCVFAVLGWMYSVLCDVHNRSQDIVVKQIKITSGQRPTKRSHTGRLWWLPSARPSIEPTWFDRVDEIRNLCSCSSCAAHGQHYFWGESRRRSRWLSSVQGIGAFADNRIKTDWCWFVWIATSARVTCNAKQRWRYQGHGDYVSYQLNETNKCSWQH